MAGKSATRPRTSGSWREGVLLPALASAVGLWAAFAPLNWSPLAWLAPLGWLLVAERQRPVGKAGYFALWLSGCLFWLLILHGIRLAFWPLHFGWLALSLYLAVYIPLFVGTTRWLRHRWRFPLALAAPSAWVGLELIRSYLLTGFAGNMLAHSQAHQPLVIQLADQLGTGGIGFVMMAVSAAALQFILAMRRGQPRSAAMPVAAATLMFVGLLAYGGWKLSEADQLAAGQAPVLRALLVQENTPSMFEYNPDRNQLAWTRYLNLTRQAAREHGDIDLVLWPESTFTANEPLLEARLTDGVPPELQALNYTEAYVLDQVRQFREYFDFRVSRVLNAAAGSEARDLSAPDSARAPHLLVGCDVWRYTSREVQRYNSALFIGPDGQLIDRYSKMHRVMFGEYIPLGSALKWLGDAFGLPSLTAGTEAKSFEINPAAEAPATEDQRTASGAGQPAGEGQDALRLAPNICFESMVPQLVSWQVRELTRRGESPDVLVNLTNDSWFRGSSALDHHLASTILAAVENRRPMLVAANTGLSAHIDGAGRLQQVSQRLQPAAILAEVTTDGRWGLVQSIGYPLAWLCATLCCAAWLAAIRRWGAGRWQPTAPAGYPGDSPGAG